MRFIPTPEKEKEKHKRKWTLSFSLPFHSFYLKDSLSLPLMPVDLAKERKIAAFAAAQIVHCVCVCVCVNLCINGVKSLQHTIQTDKYRKTVTQNANAKCSSLRDTHTNIVRER